MLLQRVTRSMAIPIPQQRPPDQCGVRNTQEEQSEEAEMMHIPEVAIPATDGQLADQTLQPHDPTPHPTLCQGEGEDMETDNDAIDVTKIMDKEDPFFCLEYAKDIYEHLRSLEVNLSMCVQTSQQLFSLSHPPPTGSLSAECGLL